MSFSLVATAKDASANSYCSLEQADELANYIPEGELYVRIPESEKAKWLVRATMVIEAFCDKQVPAKADPEQALLFPVGSETDISRDIKFACIAQAAFMFQNKDLFYQSMNDLGLTTIEYSEVQSRSPARIFRATRIYLNKYYSFNGEAI